MWGEKKLVKCSSKMKVYPSFKESKIDKEHKLIKKEVYSNKPLRLEPWQKAGICHPQKSPSHILPVEEQLEEEWENDISISLTYRDTKNQSGLSTANSIQLFAFFINRFLSPRNSVFSS